MASCVGNESPLCPDLDLCINTPMYVAVILNCNLKGCPESIIRKNGHDGKLTCNLLSVHAIPFEIAV